MSSVRGNYEIPLGTPFATLLELAGGMRGGTPLKAVDSGRLVGTVIPGAMMMQTDLDYDSIAKAGSMLGLGRGDRNERDTLHGALADASVVLLSRGIVRAMHAVP